MKTNQYVRKPFFVDAVQVTEENMAEVAKWCNGTLEAGDDARPDPYIHVDVKRPLAERQTRAFVGDWILSSGNGFKVYTNVSFEKNFEDVNHKLSELTDVLDKLNLVTRSLEHRLAVNS